jgi:hypothetical protein
MRGVDDLVARAVQGLIEDGVTEGRAQGERKLMLRLLRQRFGDQVDVEIVRQVALASSEQLLRWSARILSAATLTELLHEPGMPRRRFFKQGFEQGIKEGHGSLLLHLLRQRFENQVNTETERRVATASLEQLDLWADGILSAATLTDLLREPGRPS